MHLHFPDSDIEYEERLVENIQQEQKMSSVKEQEPLSSGQVLKNLNDTLHHMVKDFSAVILDGIITKLDLDNCITVSYLFKQTGIEKDSFEYNLFYSTYQKEILRRIEEELYVRGYKCKIATESDRYGYTNKIIYETRVMRGFTMTKMFVAIAFSAFITYGFPVMKQMYLEYMEKTSVVNNDE